MLKGTFIETGYYRLLERHFVPALAHFGVKPDHLSVLGFATSVLAGVTFAFWPAWGGFLTLLTGLVDTLDGSLARATGQARKYGAFLDSVLDRYTELIILLGVFGYLVRKGEAGPFLSVLMVLIIFGSLMVSYTRARAEGLGERCIVGFFQRGERIILLGAAGLLTPVVNGLAPESRVLQDSLILLVLFVLAFGTNFTALRRFLHVLNNLRR